jgi:hypothetical protein
MAYILANTTGDCRPTLKLKVRSSAIPGWLWMTHATAPAPPVGAGWLARTTLTRVSSNRSHLSGSKYSNQCYGMFPFPTLLYLFVWRKHCWWQETFKWVFRRRLAGVEVMVTWWLVRLATRPVTGRQATSRKHLPSPNTSGGGDAQLIWYNPWMVPNLWYIWAVFLHPLRRKIRNFHDIKRKYALKSPQLHVASPKWITLMVIWTACVIKPLRWRYGWQWGCDEGSGWCYSIAEKGWGFHANW